MTTDLRGLGARAQLGGAGTAPEPAGADASPPFLAPQGFVPCDGPHVHQQPHPHVAPGAAAQHGRLPRGV